MTVIIVLFWVLIGLILYTYTGYTLLLLIIRFFKNIFTKTIVVAPSNELPTVTLMIAAYNEYDVIIEKMENISMIDYPEDKLKVMWITDGSDDGSPELLSKYKGHTVIHQAIREGKSRAINRGMQFVETEFVVFTDANTLINKESIRLIINKFIDKNTACVSGEKRIKTDKTDNAVATGEGLYWKYESYIKKLESDIKSSIGSAGELFGLRTDLFEAIDNDVINDDFHISLQLIKKGYNVKYCPEAFATENPSLNIKEEQKRKVRIASGGIQSLVMMKGMLNPFQYGFFAFQFLSHKVFRWTVVPISFILVFLLSTLIVIISQFNKDIYLLMFLIQLLFYLFVLTGKLLRDKRIRLKFFFLPYYLWMMNYSNLAGIYRYISGKHSPKWEKAARMT